MSYRTPFLNQYAMVPKTVVRQLDDRYASEYEGVRHCIGLIVVNLLESGEIAYSRNKNFFTENHTKHCTYANMRKAVDIAVADGYVFRSKHGYRARGFGSGLSSTLIEGPRLSEFGERQDTQLDVTSLPLMVVDTRPVFGIEDLDLAKTRLACANADSRALSERLERVYAEALKLNRDYWNKMVIDTRGIDRSQKCFERVGLTRIFNGGLMGRWFQKGEMSYMQLPETERARLLLDGESVVEIDYSAMHPHILYAWESQQCPTDFYEAVTRACGCSRFVAKKIVLMSVNAKSYSSLVGAINRDKAETSRANKNRAIPEPVLYDELSESGLRAKAVVDAIADAHPAIAKYIYSASANKLMRVESDIMTDVLLKLTRLGVPALPVHDSVIVQHRHKDVARQVMQDTYSEHTGFIVVVN